MKDIRILLLLAVLGCLCACCDHDDNKSLRPGETAQRTVLIYMCAQNSLGNWNYHASDSTEIMNAHASIAPDNRLLLFVDDNRAPRLYQVTAEDNEPKLLKQWDTDICSASPRRLQEVLEIVAKNYPAREYGLVMWSHADGWIPATNTGYDTFEGPASGNRTQLRPFSFGIDSGPTGGMGDNGAQMNVDEMAQAIADAGIHCRYIFFDACLMQNLEVAYALRHQTDYIVASPMAIPAAGSYYTNEVAYGLFSQDPADIARTYLQDVQAAELSHLYSDYGLAVSCLQTDKLESLAEALKEALPRSVLAGRQSPDMSQVLNYQTYCFNFYYRPHNYDARQSLAVLLDPADTARVQRALDEAVTYYGATERFWIGPKDEDYQTVPVSTGDYRAVSLFVPQQIYTDKAKSTPHGDLNTSFSQTEWYKAAGFDATGW